MGPLAVVTKFCTAITNRKNLARPDAALQKKTASRNLPLAGLQVKFL
jgi:hypothetical protein